MNELMTAIMIITTQNVKIIKKQMFIFPLILDCPPAVAPASIALVKTDPVGTTNM
jgi:hypothetical protein